MCPRYNSWRCRSVADLRTVLPTVFVLSSLALTPTVRAQTPGSGTPVRSADACPAGRAPLMIVGTYHMANPGLDAINTEADDVLSDRRQHEIADVVSRLEAFQPTRIGVEAPAYGPTARQYRSYLAGTYSLTRNEVEQLGFRLAKARHLSEVVPVDYPMFMSGLLPQEVGEALSAPAPVSSKPSPPSQSSPAPRQLSEEEILLRQSTVAAYLKHLNEQARVAADASSYLNMLLPDSASVVIYERADRLTNLYRRNLRIFANLNRGADLAKDRVLLFIGAGHIHILSDLALTSSYYCLVSPIDYLGSDR